MKGLLLKDVAIMKTQGRSVLIILAIAVFMLLAGNNKNFVIVYANMIFVMFGVTTLNYDALDNGYSFLFTLPITRKLYVIEKYVFSFISVAIGVVLSFVLMIAANIIEKQYIITTSDVYLALFYAIGAILFLVIMLPVELKFGPEKGRIAMFAIFAAVMACVLVLKKVSDSMDFSHLLVQLSTLTPITIMGASGILAIVMLFISYMLSCRIMEKKEF